MKRLRKSYPYILIAYGALSVLFIAGFAYRAGSGVPGKPLVNTDSTMKVKASGTNAVIIKPVSDGVQAN